jgi:hypothetical protein
MSAELIPRVLAHIETLGNGPEEGAFTEDSFLVVHGLAELYKGKLKGCPDQQDLLENIGELLLISWKVYMKMVRLENEGMKKKN